MHAPQIHRIRIENFRRIREPLELDLTSPRGAPSRNVVLAGPNGCGKTSVLEAVLLGLGQEGLILGDKEKAQREHWRIEMPKGSRVELDVSMDGGPVQTWIRTPEELVTRDLGSGVEEKAGPAAMAIMAVEYFSSWRAPALVGAIKPLVGVGARPQDKERNRLWRLKQRINDDRAKGGYLPASASASKANLWLKRINDAWARFHGNDGTTIDAQIVDPDTEELEADLYLLRDGQRVCPVDQVSSGELELLSFAGWIILNDFTGGLLVIDEPELHLHARWQASLLPALRELAPDAQFLVASHADAVWEQAYSFERFLLVSEEDPRSESFRARTRAAS